MPNLPLPTKTVRLSPAGFKQIYDALRRDPAAAKAFANEIESDPRGVLEHVFRLTKGQQTAIGNTSDAELKQRSAALVTALRSKNPGDMTFDPYGGKGKPAPEDAMLTCTCMVG